MVAASRATLFYMHVHRQGDRCVVLHLSTNHYVLQDWCVPRGCTSRSALSLHQESFPLRQTLGVAAE